MIFHYINHLINFHYNTLNEFIINFDYHLNIIYHINFYHLQITFLTFYKKLFNLINIIIITLIIFH